MLRKLYQIYRQCQDDLHILWYARSLESYRWKIHGALGLLMIYLIAPLDFIPDQLLGLGQLDDIAIIVGTIRLIVRLLPPDIRRQALAQKHRN